MVTAKLYGRLGNQLFQKAAAIGYALSNRQGFAITETPNFFPCHRVREYGHNYQALKFAPHWNGDNILLDGYFQSEKYFSHCRETVLNEFGFNWEYKPSWVSIHVRRGDYLLYPDKHPVVTMEYLTKAMEYFVVKGYSSFMVFSDDILWCQQAFEHLPYTFAYSIGRTEREDLELMSGCAHNICSNSTFAWWGYWLNQNPEKIGIMPKVWFGPGNGHLETKDIYPEGVIII